MIRYKKIAHHIKPLLPGLVQALKSDKDILFAYLFGSYSIDRISPLSDVDIALYLRDDLGDFYSKKLDLIETVNKLLRTDEVDLVILNEAPLYVQFEIIKTGRLLFCGDEKKRISFQTKVMKIYLDAERLRTFAQASLLKKYNCGD